MFCLSVFGLPDAEAVARHERSHVMSGRTSCHGTLLYGAGEDGGQAGALLAK